MTPIRNRVRFASFITIECTLVILLFLCLLFTNRVAPAYAQQVPAEEGEKSREKPPATPETVLEKIEKEIEPKPPAEPEKYPEPTFMHKLEDILEARIDGNVSFKYRLRRIHGERDRDSYGYLQLRLGDPERDEISASLFGRVSWDMDGEQDTDGYYVFDSITDTFDHCVNGRLYYAYADVKDDGYSEKIKYLRRVRVGRQYVFEGETMHFDGARLDSEMFKALMGFQVFVYGGVPVNLYESSPKKDWLAGVGTQLRPFRTTKITLDWAHLEDDTAFYGDKHTDLVTLSTWQQISEHLAAHGRISFLENKGKDYLLRTSLNWPEKGVFAQADYYRQLKILKEDAIEFDPYYWQLAEYHPFQQLNVVVVKGLSEKFTLGAGLLVRELLEDKNEGPQNHEFQRCYITPSIHDWPFEGTEISVTGEIWNSSGDEIRTLDAEASHECMKNLKAAIGRCFSLYKYDYYSGEEKDEVQTVFFKFEFGLLEVLDFSFKYEYETDDFERYHTLELVSSIHFN